MKKHKLTVRTAIKAGGIDWDRNHVRSLLK